MRFSIAVFILFTAVLLSACRIDPVPTIARLEAEPHISGLKTIEVDQATADSIRRHIGPYAGGRCPRWPGRLLWF